MANSVKQHTRHDSSQRRPILRVRTGCLTCRGRKKKCDEAKPVCAGCRRNELQCEWPTSMRDGRNRKKKRKRNHAPHEDIITTPGQSRLQQQDPAISGGDESLATTALEPQNTNGIDFGRDDALDGIANLSCTRSASNDSPSGMLFGNETPQAALSQTQDTSEQQRPSSRGSSANLIEDSSTGSADNQSHPQAQKECSEWVLGSSEHPDAVLDNMIATMPVEEQQSMVQAGPSPPFGLGMGAPSPNFDVFPACSLGIPRSMALLSDTEEPTYELLGFYLSRTALSMGNGSTDSNPFISQLIPLAFTNKFVLGLILCQSAVHRATEDTGQLVVAEKYYNKSLRSFRKTIDEYISGQDGNPLWLALGALIMCFTETAKGDIDGTLFDHLDAAGPLLSSLMSHSNALPDGLKNFIIEYYVNLVTISMISIDPAFSSPQNLSPDFEGMAEQMVGESYVGQLCGTWLELLLLIPRIFELAQRSSSFRRPDDFIDFSTLQLRILSFVPSATASRDAILCGNIFKQATHIYLLTALNITASPEGQVKQYVDSCVAEAFTLLWELAPDARVNTSLCWALAVIGSCVRDEARQNELRFRLNTMFLAIGLGNIRATSLLLDKMWKLPEQEQSPWTICRVMCENEMFMSFV